MQLYIKYKRPNTFGSTDIVQVNVLQNQVGPFMEYLYVKYQNPIPYGSKDIAQVKVFVTPTLTPTPGS